MDNLAAALRYLNHGLAPIPIWPDKRKNPHLSSFKEFCHQLPTVGMVRRWFNRWPRANVGLITGYWLNYVALDFDDVDDYEFWCIKTGFDLRGQTWTVATARGYHVWFRLPDDPGKSRMFIREGREVLLRAKGGYCIAPPSIHHTGAKYKTVHNVPVLATSGIEDFLHGWTEKSECKSDSSQLRAPNTAVFATRIEELIEPVGQPNGRGAQQCFCPFHQDGKPSAWLNVGQQRFGCNACWPGQWFDLANVVAMLEGISNNDALKKIRASR